MFMSLQSAIDEPADFDSPLFGPISNEKSPKSSVRSRERNDSHSKSDSGKETVKEASASGSDSENSRYVCLSCTMVLNNWSGAIGSTFTWFRRNS